MCGHRSCSYKPHIVTLMEYLCLFPLMFFCWRCWPSGWAGSSWSKWGTCQRDRQLSICPKFLFQCWSIFPTLFMYKLLWESCFLGFYFFLSYTFANVKIQVCFFLLALYSCCLQRRWSGFSGVFYRISEIHNLFSDKGYLKFSCFWLCRLEPCKDLQEPLSNLHMQTKAETRMLCLTGRNSGLLYS